MRDFCPLTRDFDNSLSSVLTLLDSCVAPTVVSTMSYQLQQRLTPDYDLWCYPIG